MIRTSVCNQNPHQMAAGACPCEHRYCLALSQLRRSTSTSPLASATVPLPSSPAPQMPMPWLSCPTSTTSLHPKPVTLRGRHTQSPESPFPAPFPKSVHKHPPLSFHALCGLWVARSAMKRCPRCPPCCEDKDLGTKPAPLPGLVEHPLHPSPALEMLLAQPGARSSTV